MKLRLSLLRTLPQQQARTRPMPPRTMYHQGRISSSLIQASFFTTVHRRYIESSADSSYSQPAQKLNQNITQEERDHYDRQIAENKSKQIRTPWQREGPDKPPVAQPRSAGAMTKGKLLTTPSRMLKLIVPLTTRDYNQDRKDVEPLALLVHPQQPLSYLERLIQAELPLIKDGDKERVPNVYFRAEDTGQDASSSSPTSAESESKSKSDGDLSAKAEKKRSDPRDDHHGADAESGNLESPDAIKIDGKVVRTGKMHSRNPSSASAQALRGGPGEGGVEVYSGLGREAPTPASKADDGKKNGGGEPGFVRWSGSTEIGDFIRDAARGREFSIEIEGAPDDIRVGVPSFNDRTYYLRMRLRNTSRKIGRMADVKQECDRIAHNVAQRVALGGFGVLCGWWYLVYRLTFETELGWDVMEPITYLVGLSSLMGGYVWFLYHNREVSYRSAMKFTISRRQQKLYADRGFDLEKWQGLIEDGNALRKEIKMIANEYDVEWDERADELMEEKVTEALRKEREKAKKKGKGKDEEEEEES